MRLLICLCLFAQPATAWEFFASPICTLSHVQDDVEVTVTYDPRAPKAYAMYLQREGDWPDAPVFAIRFDPFGPFISTDRHKISGNVLVASDSGFENVLIGLERNPVALARIGDETVIIGLENAAPEVARFRACGVTPSV